MRILITNNQLNLPGGSETWVLTMSQAFRRMGHDVEVYTRELGEFARKFKCPVTDDIDSLEDYDLVLVNHTTCWDDVKHVTGKKVYTSHSIVIDIEQYPEDAEIRVAATAEVAVKMGGLWIPNAIDTSRFRSISPLSPQPKAALYLGKSVIFGGFNVIREAFKDLELITPQMKLVTPELVNSVDIVIGYGRAALEGLACGRNVISADCRIYMSKDEVLGGGMITTDNIEALEANNFTGRGKPIAFDVDSLRAEIDKYDPERDLSPYIYKHYNAERIAQKYLSLAFNQMINEGYYT